MKLRNCLAPICFAAAAALLASCSGSGTGSMTSVPAAGNHVAPLAAPVAISTPVDEETIGSTSPTTPADVNPYGLDVEKATNGKIDAGDLVVCDFNNPGNVQGTGTEIVSLHPVVGSTPTLIAKSNTLMGCNALATAPNGNIWLAAFKANDNPIFTGAGALVTTLANGPWHHPFGQTFAPPKDANHHPAFYVSNAGDGSLVRVNIILPGPTFTFDIIATGFPVNGGKPGSILSPSGLNYEAATDTLIVVDGTNNALYAINDVSDVPANGIAVDPSGVNFSGPSNADAHVIFTGAPLNGPISSALLSGGNIAVGNTLDPDGKNLIVEISPAGSVLKVINVDTGAAGAIFGMVFNTNDSKLYFNDDNDNTVKRFTP